MTFYVGDKRICPLIRVVTGVSESLINEVVSGEGTVDITELEELETQVSNCLNP